MIRKPAVEGQFYQSSPKLLEREIIKFIDETVSKKEVLGVVSPHAGYMYSGPVAGACFSMIKFKDKFIILGPNHTGYGKPFSIMTEGTWRTPLGDVEIDAELAREVVDKSSYLEEDEKAHLYEHSIEVQLPFLQYFNPAIKIVPIILSHSEGKIYKEIGREISSAIKELKSKVIIIASSDMTHYESYESAKFKDSKAIDAILKLDEDELISQVEKLDISMCGYGPAVSLISAAKELGAKSAELVKYQTSGEVSGDYTSVVGYAGIIIR